MRHDQDRREEGEKPKTGTRRGKTSEKLAFAARGGKIEVREVEGLEAATDMLLRLQVRRGLQGKQGPRGALGPQGKAGVAGPQEPRGPQGAKGERGEKGDSGPRRLQGPAGPRGEPGLQGKHGERGLQVRRVRGVSPAPGASLGRQVRAVRASSVGSRQGEKAMNLRCGIAAILLCVPFSVRSETMVASYYTAPAPHIAAHRTLPLGTRLIVTNPRNGRSAHVVVRDRGPFLRGRSLDISTTRAKQLGLTRSGVAPLKARVLRR